MADRIHMTIDGTAYAVPADATILKAAQSEGIAIPSLCYHDFCTANALCRVCAVEVEGSRLPVPACVARVSEGMKVTTASERVLRARRTILEMLCASVDLSEAPEILKMLQDCRADLERFPQAKRRAFPLVDDNPMYVRDYSKCILCWRCVQVCASDAQYAYAINFAGRGFETQISTFYGRPMLETTCVFCGQCVGVCPTGALKPRREWLLQQKRPIAEVLAVSRREKRRGAGENR
jgi:NADH dehydrogenase/NADH:ubiquinone oxidoreductase subunit G